MRVLELGDSVESAKAARVLACLGADVIKVEDVDSSGSLRSLYVTAGSPLHLSLNAGKRSIACRYDHSDAHSLVARLAACCEVAVIAPGPGGSLWAAASALLGAARPFELVFDEPAQFYDGYATSGHLDTHGTAETPELGPPNLPAMLTGLVGVIGVYAGLLGKLSSARASTVRSMAALYFRSAAAAEYTRGSTHPSDWAPHIYPSGVFSCLDGEVALFPLTDEKWARLCMLMGHPWLAEDERTRTNDDRVVHYELVNEHLLAWLATRSRAEVVTLCQELGVPSGSVQSLPECLNDPQTHARQSFQQARATATASYMVPAVPDGRAPLQPEARVPGLGADTRAVLKELLSLLPEEVDRLLQKGVIA